MKQAARLQIDVGSAVPATRQIVDGLRALLVEGALQSGNELPAVRRLAFDLGVHFNTVAEAYRILADEGWLDVGHGRAARVLDRTAPPHDQQQALTFRKRLRELVAEMRSAGIPIKRILDELHAIAEALR
jgi:DNA-binding transcriptional regulator YhcF (GntR family)